MNPENIYLKKHPIPAGYRLANAKDMKRKRAQDGWMCFARGAWRPCCGLVLVQKHWTYLVPISKPKARK
jgi:uncharacterized protein YbdZ (MbtH family)